MTGELLYTILLQQFVNRILPGHCLDRLRDLPDGCIQTAVTSPPYWGLRAYGTSWQIWGGDANCDHEWQSAPPRRTRHVGDVVDANSKQATSAGTQHDLPETNFCSKCGAWKGELGLEPTPELYVEHLVSIFREIRRVLRKDGTLWLNLGDSYAGSWGNYGGQNRGSVSQRSITTGSKAVQKCYAGLEQWRPPAAHDLPGLKPKDLCGIPWRVAFALQQDGWWLRSDTIWHKPNPMPESVTDRPTRSHEYIFLLTKSAKYFYDAEAIKERIAESTANDSRLNREGYDVGRPERNFPGGAQRGAGLLVPQGDKSSRNCRSVWTMPTKPYPEAHFATFPIDLPRRCIAAGTSERGCCPHCGAPWERILEKKRLTRPELPKDDPRYRPSTYSGAYEDINGKGDAGYTESTTLGWQPTCSCYGNDAKRLDNESLSDFSFRISHFPVSPCTVLDPFLGAGTTALAALQLGRHFIGIELNPEYIKLAETRLSALIHQSHLPL